MIRSIKRFFFNIKRIIEWIPILYNNFDWDYYYLLKIISFKLKLMEKHFREDGVTMSAEKHANEMKSMIEICDRLIEDNYTEIPYEIAESKHDKDIEDFSKGFLKIRSWWD